MKILITTDWYKPSINGVVTSVLNLYNELTEKGHDVKILTLSKSISSHRDGDVYYIKSIPFNVYPEVRASLLFFDSLVDELVSWEPDVVHSQCEFFTYTYAKIVAKRSNAPIVHTYHTMYEEYSSYLKINKELSHYIIAFLSKARLKDASVVIAPTSKVQKMLRGYYITNDIKVIPTGIDLSKFNIPFGEEDKIEIRRKYGLPDDAKIIIYLGRIGKEKNITELIKGFNLIKNKYDNLYLFIVGGGPYEKNIENTIKKLNLSHKVIMTGMVDPSTVPYYYKTADIFASASQSETQGLTYIEAMSNGLPLVCKYDECLENVLIPGFNGYFFDSPEDFINKAVDIIYNEETLTTMSENSLEKSKTFGKEFFAESVMNVYKLALTIHKSRPRKIDIQFDEIWNVLKLNRQIEKVRRIGKRWFY